MKLWEIHIVEITESEFEESKRSLPKMYRYGESKRQVESRIRYTENLYDHDNSDGSVSIRYDFNITEVVKQKGYEQLSLFEI